MKSRFYILIGLALATAAPAQIDHPAAYPGEHEHSFHNRRNHSGTRDEGYVEAVALETITLSGPQLIDGHAVLPNEKVLVVAQGGAPGTPHVDNGVWVVKAGAWLRPSDHSQFSSEASGLRVWVEQGDTCEHTMWELIDPDAHWTVDTDPQTWRKAPAYNILTIGDGPPPAGTSSTFYCDSTSRKLHVLDPITGTYIEKDEDTAITDGPPDATATAPLICDPLTGTLYFRLADGSYTAKGGGDALDELASKEQIWSKFGATTTTNAINHTEAEGAARTAVTVVGQLTDGGAGRLQVTDPQHGGLNLHVQGETAMGYPQGAENGYNDTLQLLDRPGYPASVLDLKTASVFPLWFTSGNQFTTVEGHVAMNGGDEVGHHHGYFRTPTRGFLSFLSAPRGASCGTIVTDRGNLYAFAAHASSFARNGAQRNIVQAGLIGVGDVMPAQLPTVPMRTSWVATAALASPAEQWTQDGSGNNVQQTPHDELAAIALDLLDAAFAVKCLNAWTLIAEFQPASGDEVAFANAATGEFAVYSRSALAAAGWRGLGPRVLSSHLVGPQTYHGLGEAGEAVEPLRVGTDGALALCERYGYALGYPVVATEEERDALMKEDSPRGRRAGHSPVGSTAAERVTDYNTRKALLISGSQADWDKSPRDERTGPRPADYTPIPNIYLPKAKPSGK